MTCPAQRRRIWRTSERLPDGTRRAATIRVASGHGAAEVHAHTLASDGMVTGRELVRAAADIGLHVLCITDHDTMTAVAAAQEAGAEFGVDVVSGQEITAAGPAGAHVIALFLERPVRMGMPVEDTVDAIRDHGGLAIIAHPLMPTYFASLGRRRLQRLIDRGTVDGIELRHTAVMAPGGFARLDGLYADHRDALGAALGAGDSHFGRHDLGRVVTMFPGTTAADLRRAIETRTTSPARGLAPEPPPTLLRLAQQRRSLWWLPRERRSGRVGGGVGPTAVRG